MVNGNSVDNCNHFVRCRIGLGSGATGRTAHLDVSKDFYPVDQEVKS